MLSIYVKVWNDELAYLAALNCLRCYYGPDACRNTRKNCLNVSGKKNKNKTNIFSDVFPHVGQNIDLYWNSTGYLTNTELINRVFNTWFNEYQLANMGVIKSYYSTG